MSVLSGSAAELRVRLAALPVSVPTARRFVTDGLTTWGRETLVDDAALCVSELSSNVALHTESPFFDVVLQSYPESVRVCVEDSGSTHVDAVVPLQTNGNDAGNGHAGEELTTGRGLAIVSILATRWGVEEITGGKRVWFELVRGDDEHPVRLPQRSAARAGANVPAPYSDDELTELPQGRQAVRLVDCPVQLLMRQDEQVHALIRELQLLGADPDEDPSREIADLMEGLVERHASSWHLRRQMTHEAVNAGQEVVTLTFAFPVKVLPDVLELNRLERVADVLCEEQQLMTLASPPDVQLLREWMAEEFRRQIDRGELPTPYGAWLAARDR